MYLLLCSIFDDGSGDAAAGIDCSVGCALLTIVAIRDTFHFDAFTIVEGPRETYNHRVFPLNMYSLFCKQASKRERSISGIYVTTASIYSLHFCPSANTAYTHLSSLKTLCKHASEPLEFAHRHSIFGCLTIFTNATHYRSILIMKEK